jgi:hypothetical protein
MSVAPAAAPPARRSRRPHSPTTGRPRSTSQRARRGLSEAISFGHRASRCGGQSNSPLRRRPPRRPASASRDAGRLRLSGQWQAVSVSGDPAALVGASGFRFNTPTRKVHAANWPPRRCRGRRPGLVRPRMALNLRQGSAHQRTAKVATARGHREAGAVSTAVNAPPPSRWTRPRSDGTPVSLVPARSLGQSTGVWPGDEGFPKSETLSGVNLM